MSPILWSLWGLYVQDMSIVANIPLTPPQMDQDKVKHCTDGTGYLVWGAIHKWSHAPLGGRMGNPKNYFRQSVNGKGGEGLLNKIKIRPIAALLEVLWFTTFSIYLVFQFEWQFTFEWHSNLRVILIWVTFQFECHSNLSDFIVWLTFQF